MERIIRRMFLVGCLLTGLAVSFTAAGGYAVETTGSTAATTGAEMSTDFSLTVGPAFALTNVAFTGTVVDGTAQNYIQAIPGSVSTGTLSATVQSNTGYALQLSAATPALTSSANDTIPARTFAYSTTITQSGWGVQQNGTGNYVALTTTPANFFSTTDSAPTGKSTNLTVGVGIAKTQAAGNYSTTVTLTVVKQP